MIDMQHMRMPPEWALHDGTILTWPHRPDIWRGVHAQVEQTFAQLAAELSEVETVHLNVPDVGWRNHVQSLLERAGAQLRSVQWHLIDSDDVWARDHGPIFVIARPDAPPGTPPLAMLDWTFNAWGGKFASALDDRIPQQMNETFGVPRIEPGLVMEGGSLDVNGAGDLLTTEAVLLHDNRNPGYSQDDIASILRRHLGVSRLHWLGAGLHGDDTDGHVDDIARFVDARTIVMVQPPVGHADHAAMAANWQRLAQTDFALVPLPVPEPLDFQGEPLPASYANFYVCNQKVLVPTFAQPTDAEALSVLQAVFPDRRVVGIDGRWLVTQSGNIHCVTQQVPRP